MLKVSERGQIVFLILVTGLDLITFACSIPLMSRNVTYPPDRHIFVCSISQTPSHISAVPLPYCTSTIHHFHQPRNFHNSCI
jgi:hypothetical protein